MNSPPPIAAVVAVTHNSSHAIDSWIDALTALGVPLELCVVDAGSRPDELARLRERVGGRARLVEVDNVGFGRACNAGAAATTAPALIFTNPDTRVRALPSELTSGGSIAGTVLGAIELEADGTRTPLGYAHLPSAGWETRDLLLGNHSNAYVRTAERPAWVSGAALAMARSDFVRAGGFSDELFLYFEDADLCATHVERGGGVRVDPAFVVEHDGGQSSQDHPVGVELDGVARQSGRIFARRHGGRGGRARAAGLYALLLAWYVPRRVAISLLRRLRGRPAPASLRELALNLAFPSRVKRRLGAR